MNVPNQLSIARVLAAVVLFVALEAQWYLTGMWIFLFATVTDYVDGYWARKYGQITQLGRILDPFADKFITCGTFVYLAANPLSRVTAWMAVVILGREMLVTTIRSFFEQQGTDFSAKWPGKWKMALQCAAILAELWRLSRVVGVDGGPGASPIPAWLNVSVDTLLWAAIAMTIYSGLGYIKTAGQLLRGPVGS